MNFVSLDLYWVNDATNEEKWTMWNCLTSMLMTGQEPTLENFKRFHNGSHSVLAGMCRSI